MIQIRHVPDALYRKLKARAAVVGKSLSDYLLAEIGRIAPSRRARRCLPASTAVPVSS